MIKPRYLEPINSKATKVKNYNDTYQASLMQEKASKLSLEDVNIMSQAGYNRLHEYRKENLITEPSLKLPNPSRNGSGILSPNSRNKSNKL